MAKLLPIVPVLSSCFKVCGLICTVVHAEVAWTVLGFEHVFTGEIKNGEVSGFHNWIQFYLEEQKGTLDYRDYIKPRSSGEAQQDDNDYLLTLQFAWNRVEKFVGTSFIGVSSEFEMALYSMCFLVGKQENNVQLNTGKDTFDVLIKCYTMAEGKIGTIYPEVTSHYEH